MVAGTSQVAEFVVTIDLFKPQRDRPRPQG